MALMRNRSTAVEDFQVGLWRDNSGRLTVDHSGITAEQYPAVCRQLADTFGLTPLGDIIIGPEQMFWNFQRDGQVVGLDWDIWLEFIAVAQSPASEPLVAKIAEWLAAFPKTDH